MRVDSTELEIFKNLFHSVAEEMGAALRRSALNVARICQSFLHETEIA